MASYTVIHEKAACFYDCYARKSELQQQTHYCPGCGKIEAEPEPPNDL